MYSSAAATVHINDPISETLSLHPPLLPPSSSPSSFSQDLPITGFSIPNFDALKAHVELSTEQRFLLNQVIRKKKSIFFTGSAGTGKSVLLRQLIEELKKIYQPGQVAVTASTGIAACNIGGCTIHSFAGVGLGTGTVGHLMNKLKSNKKAYARWRKVRVLIIDEVSMIDGGLFDKLEEIARKVRRNSKPFGGIQLVITGDFFQLPPVVKDIFSLESTPSSSATSIRHRRYGSSSTTTIFKRATEDSKSGNNSTDDDLFLECLRYNEPLPLPVDADESIVALQATLCFDAKSWSSCINSSLQLTEVFRQRDPIFIKMLNEMRHGNLSEETCRIFKELARTPKYPNDGIKATELFARRHQVEDANNRYLAELPGSVRIYEPQDDGPLKQLLDKTCTAPSRLQLKENAQVMLVKNLTPTLVNGTMGLVVGFKEESVLIDKTHEWVKSYFPIVRFQGESDDLIIRPEEWKMELPNGDVMASRVQIPLILSWAISIHKSQGQTMERVKVDMGKIFESGQAYVALSRATSLDGLQVLNFNKRLVQAHERVGEFYNKLTTVQDLIGQERAEVKEPTKSGKKSTQFLANQKTLEQETPVVEKPRTARKKRSD